MRVPRHASSSQAAFRKRTFHVLIQPDTSCANDTGFFLTVVSKLKCPLFVAHDMSGLGAMDRRRRGCGKVGIPRLLRDFQAQWKTCFWFSKKRLFHSLSPAIQFALAQPRPSLRGVATDDVWPVPDTPGFIQMLAHRDRTSRERSPPARRLD